MLHRLNTTLYLLVQYYNRFCCVSVTPAKMMVWPAETEMFIPSDHAWCVRMSRRLRCGSWSHIAITVCLFLALFPCEPLFVQSTISSANFSFSTTSSPDDFISMGETQYNPETPSFTFKPNPAQLRLLTSKLVYREKVRMKNGKSNAVASFSTSLKFSITQEEQSTVRSGWLSFVAGLVLVFTTGTNVTLYPLELVELDVSKYLSIEFDTYNSFGDADPSDNHIGIGLNSLRSAYTYNLCGNQETSCSFPWTGQNYTAWIDYNGSTQSMELWFANGDTKPTGAGLIKVPKLDLNDVFDEYMCILISGNAGPFLDTWEIFSWNFTTYHEQIPPPTVKRIVVVIIGAACSIAILIAVTYLIRNWRIGRAQLHSNKSSLLGLNLPSGYRRFTFKELKKATKNFSESALLGKGGSGSVYKGILTDSGMVVAVKRLRHDSGHVEGEFLAELSSVSQIRHRNLVQLIGWCHEDQHFILVFDYLSYGSLEEWLFPSRRRHPHDPMYKKFEVLPWKLRSSILAGVAAGMEYLHGEWVKCVLHRDIKSSNVLLDEDFNPRLGDFGLARLIDHHKLGKTTLMAGTLGYMDPGMHYTGRASRESDVYSFGVLMLEVICGKNPIDIQIEDPDENYLLVQKVWQAYESGNILSAVDRELLVLYSHQLTPSNSSTQTSSESSPLTCNSVSSNTSTATPSESSLSSNSTLCQHQQIVYLLHLALQCCLLDPQSRPSMSVVKQVIMNLQSSAIAENPITTFHLMPPLPSTVPVSRYVPGALKSIVMHPDDGQATFLPRTETMSVLRRRFDSSHVNSEPGLSI